MALPQSVTEYQHMIVSGRVFTRSPSSSEQWACSKQREEVRFRGDTHNVIGLSPAAKVHGVGPTDEGDVLEAVILRLPVQEVRPGERIIAWSCFGFVQANQLPRLLIRQGTQKRCIDDAEDGCVRTNSHGQRKDCDYGKPWRPAQTANAITDVLGQSVHLTLLKQAFRRLACRMVRNFAENG